MHQQDFEKHDIQKDHCWSKIPLATEIAFHSRAQKSVKNSNTFHDFIMKDFSLNHHKHFHSFFYKSPKVQKSNFNSFNKSLDHPGIILGTLLTVHYGVLEGPKSSSWPPSKNTKKVREGVDNTKTFLLHNLVKVLIYGQIKFDFTSLTFLAPYPQILLLCQFRPS